MHSHPRYEFLYVRKGALRFHSEQTEIFCPRGSVLLLPASLRHIIVSAEQETETDSFLYEPCGKIKDDPLFDALCVKKPTLLSGIPNCADRLTRIREQLPSQSLTHTEKIHGEAILLFADIAEALLPDTQTPELSAEENRAEQIQLYIYKHCHSSDCTCSALAETLHLSPRQIHRLCIKYYGMPFRDLLHRMRMDIAAYRLQHEETSITTIAEQMGYSSVSSFSAAYKRYFGYAPTKKNGCI